MQRNDANKGYALQRSVRFADFNAQSQRALGVYLSADEFPIRFPVFSESQGCQARQGLRVPAPRVFSRDGRWLHAITFSSVPFSPLVLKIAQYII